MIITIWSDFACPYCYIGETRLQKAIDQLGIADKVTIDHRAYELDPNASKEVRETIAERLALKYGLSLSDARVRINRICEMGRDLGLDFRYDTALFTNTRDAHRLMKLAEAKYDRAVLTRLNTALFDAYFTKNESLANPQTLLRIARFAGMNPEDVRSMLASDEYADAVRFDESEAAMHGIRGVPYMIFDGEFAVPGALDIESCKTALLRALRLSAKRPSADFAPACRL